VPSLTLRFDPERDGDCFYKAVARKREQQFLELKSRVLVFIRHDPAVWALVCERYPHNEAPHFFKTVEAYVLYLEGPQHLADALVILAYSKLFQNEQVFILSSGPYYQGLLPVRWDPDAPYPSTVFLGFEDLLLSPGHYFLLGTAPPTLAPVPELFPEHRRAFELVAAAFGVPALHNFQKRALVATQVQKKDVLLTASTAAGKSLAFQVSSALYFGFGIREGVRERQFEREIERVRES
jgi:hypothetical protein